LRGDVFDEMGWFWAEIADESQTQRQIRFLKAKLSPEGSVLDVACGTGRHTIALYKAGFDVVGLDISSNLLRIAKKRGASALVRGDMRFLPFKHEAFTVAVSMDNSFGYLPSEKEDEQSLVEVKRVLKAGSLFLLDVFNRIKLQEKYNSMAASPKSYEYPSFTLQQERSVSPDGDWLCDHWTVKPHKGDQVQVFDHKARLYTYAQLESILSEADFTVESIFGDYEKQPFSAASPRLIIKANAKQHHV
jgi:ubiquinone/menaquinone biosynthesis C-methylase UbiE